MFDLMRVYTKSVPTSIFPFDCAIDAHYIAGILGWNAEGEPVARILDLLTQGVGVEVGSKQTGALYQFFPMPKDFPQGKVPDCPRVVQL